VTAMKHFATCVLVCCGLAGCLVGTNSLVAPSRESAGPDWVCIGEISNSDLSAQTHIAALLEMHSIPFRMEGTVAFGVSVPMTNASSAIEVLVRDCEERLYEIAIFGRKEMRFYAIPKDCWIRIEKKQTYTDLLKKYAETTPAGKALREAHVQGVAAAAPYIASLTALRRELLSEAGILQSCWDFYVEMADRSEGEDSVNGAWIRLRLYGNSVQFMFGVPWGEEAKEAWMRLGGRQRG
jgi:hypothetical protein